MGKNKFENFIFSLSVCFLMVLGMTVYNMVLASTTTLTEQQAAMQFFGVFAIAFVIDWFVVAPVVKRIVKTVTNEHTSFVVRIIMISGLMVLLMCTAMSLVATIAHGYSGSFWDAYLHAFGMNIIFALPLQLLLVGPVVRTVFVKVFPAPMPANT